LLEWQTHRLEENVVEIPKIKLKAKKLCFKIKKNINAKEWFKLQEIIYLT
jgi:hypothetical protein